MKIELKKINGKGSGKKINIADTIFSIKPNDHAIYLDIKNHLANQRQGTSKVKERGEIVGSTKKIKKQKGTGTARAGSIKSPLFKGGGQIFGPKPRDYKSKVNKNTFTEKNLVKKLYFDGKESVLDILNFKILTNKKIDQKIIDSDLEHIAQELINQNFESPVIFYIGKNLNHLTAKIAHDKELRKTK